MSSKGKGMSYKGKGMSYKGKGKGSDSGKGMSSKGKGSGSGKGMSYKGKGSSSAKGGSTDSKGKGGSGFCRNAEFFAVQVCGQENVLNAAAFPKRLTHKFDCSITAMDRTRD